MLLVTTVVLALLAVVVAVALRAPGRPALALLVLLLPVAFAAPDALKANVERARERAALGETAAARFAAPRIQRARNLPLALAAERLIPPEAVYGVVAVPGPTPSTRRPSGLAGIAWTQFWLAPRIAKRGPDAAWVVVYGGSPEEVGISYRRAWRFRDDWLVQR